VTPARARFAIIVRRRAFRKIMAGSRQGKGKWVSGKM
jgi:hypothetical protein